MTEQWQYQLLVILENIVNGDRSVVDPEHEAGLCFVIASKLPYIFARNSELWMRKKWVDWEYYSGNVMYPVPPFRGYHDPKGYMQSNIFKETANLWIGEYGDLRLELCSFLLEELQKDMKAGVV